MNRLAHLVREKIGGPSTTTEGTLSTVHDGGQCQQMSAAAPPRKKLGIFQPQMIAAPAPYAAIPRKAAHSFPIVGTAYLELVARPLHQQIYEFCLRVKAAGVTCVKIVPIFLLQGVHVMEDIPQEVALAEELLKDRITIHLCPHLGSHGHLDRFLKAKISDTATESCILLAHGSRRPGGNRSVEMLAHSLGAALAFWSVPPSLETQVVHLMQAGCQRLTILPYFLFSGGTTDAITRVTEELAERFPKIGFRLLPPLGAIPEIAQFAADLAQNCCPERPNPLAIPMKRVALRH